MDLIFVVLIGFLISLIVSAIIIYAITSLLGEEEGGGTALLAALVGAVIYGLAYYFLGNGLLAAVLGGIGWVIALGGLYDIGWLKAAVIALLVWIVATVVSWFLPVYLPLA
jgi:Na+/melibiose symporter-like transporter